MQGSTLHPFLAGFNPAPFSLQGSTLHPHKKLLEKVSYESSKLFKKIGLVASPKLVLIGFRRVCIAEACFNRFQASLQRRKLKLIGEAKNYLIRSTITSAASVGFV